MKNTSFKDRCFKDQKGNVVLGQTPNLPIKVAFSAYVLGIVIDNGKLGDFIDILGFGALFTFAWLELFEGVNYLRRFFGFMILATLLFTRVF
jgi:hypothetical protein